MNYSTLPRRVFNSPLIELANFANGSHVNLIRLTKPYANGLAWAVNNATKEHPISGCMFKTFEKAKAKFELMVQEMQKESRLVAKGNITKIFNFE